jgi:3-methyladenine DNA glycosylase AlkD
MTLAARLRSELAAVANAEDALAMQAYMKSSMPYHGVRAPVTRAICRRVFAAEPLTTCAAWRAAVLELWRGAAFREERYAAIDLLGLSQYRKCRSLRVMPVLEEMIVDGAWWDVVDEVAGIVGELLLSHPAEMKPRMRAWSTDPHLWKRRVSIICQNSFKRDTDLSLLYANIEPNLADRDFFIRKAIGWALRSYAWTDPGEVARYVLQHQDRLSGLSRREALKNIG